jgi:hypothetical protein
LGINSELEQARKSNPQSWDKIIVYSMKCLNKNLFVMCSHKQLMKKILSVNQVSDYIYFFIFFIE